MNKVILIGRLTRDPEIKSTQNNTTVAQFNVAVDRKYKDANGNKQTDFINCTAWRQTAEFIGRYFHKGSKIVIEGSIQTRNYEKDGAKVYVTEVLVENVEFAESASQTAQEPAPTAPEITIPEPQASEDIDLPFEV